MEKQTMSDDRFLDTAPVSLDGPGMSIEFMSADLLERVKKEELSVEEAFASLDQIVQKMEEETGGQPQSSTETAMNAVRSDAPEEPETIPHSAEEITATLAGPPANLPVSPLASAMKNSEMPVFSRNAPNMINTTIYLEHTFTGVERSPFSL